MMILSYLILEATRQRENRILPCILNQQFTVNPIEEFGLTLFSSAILARKTS